MIFYLSKLWKPWLCNSIDLEMVSCGQKEAHHLFINPPEGLHTIPCGQAKRILWVKCHYRKPQREKTKLFGHVGIWAGEQQFVHGRAATCHSAQCHRATQQPSKISSRIERL